MSVSLSDDTLEKLESHGIDFDEIDLDDPDFHVRDFFDAVDAIDDPELRKKAYIVFFTDDDYYGLYTKADKPPLLKEELDLDDDEIVAVSDSWLSRTGDEFQLWWDLRIIETADGDRHLIHEEITPELYEQSEKVLQDGDVGNGQPDYVDEVPEEVMKWFLRMEDAGYEVYGPDSTIILPSSMSDIVHTIGIGPRNSEGERISVFGSKIEVNDPYSKMYDIEGDVITVEMSDGQKIVISEEYTPEAFAMMKNLAEVMGDLESQVRDGDLILLQREDDTPVLSIDDKLEYIRDENGNVIDGGVIVHRKNGDSYLVMEGISPEQFQSISEYQSARNRSYVDDIFRSHDVPVTGDTNLMEIETEVEDDDGNKLTVGELYLKNLEDRHEALENGDTHVMSLKKYNIEFYVENFDAINTLIDNWDDWSSGDRLSKKDLESLLEDGDLSEVEQKTIEFLLEDDDGKGFFDLLDTLYKGGESDGVVSKHDLNAWKKLSGLEPIPSDGKIFDRTEEYTVGGGPNVGEITRTRDIDLEDIELDGDELEFDEEAAEKLEELLFLLEIQGQLKDGTFEIQPYQIVEDVAGADEKRLPDTQGMDIVNLRGMVDEHALGKRIEELMQDDAIALMSRDAMINARESIEDVDGLIDTLYESLTGDGAADYVAALDELKENGLEAEAQQRLERDLDTLELLDPEKAEEAREQILAAGFGVEIDEIMELMDAEYESGEYSDESLDIAEQVASDLTMSFIPAFIFTNFLAQSAPGNAKLMKEFMNGARNGFDKINLENFSSEERQQLGKMMVAYDTLKNTIKDEVLKGSKAGEISASEVDEQIKKSINHVSQTYGIEVSEDGIKNVKHGFQKLLGSQALNGIGGLGALSGVMYRIFGEDSEWTGQTHEERMAQTRSALVFLGSIPYSIQTLDNMFGKDANWTSALGLDKQMSDIFADNFPDSTFGAKDTIAEQYTQLQTGFNEKIKELKEINDKIENGDVSDKDRSRAATLVNELEDVQKEMRTLIESDERLSEEQKRTLLADNTDVGDRVSTISDNGLGDSSSTNHIDYMNDRVVVEGVIDRTLDKYNEKANEINSIIETRAASSSSQLTDAEQERINQLLNGMQEDLEVLDEAKNNASNQGTLSNDSADRINTFTFDASEQIDSMQEKIGGSNVDARDLTVDSNGMVMEAFYADMDVKLGYGLPPNELELMNDRITYNGIEGSLYDDTNMMSGGNGENPGNTPSNSSADGVYDVTQGRNSKKWYNNLGPVMNFLSYGTDFAGGIIDLTLSALRMDDLLKGEDATDLQIAGESMFLMSGGYFTIGGAGSIGSAVIGQGAAHASKALNIFRTVSRFAGPVGNVAGLVTGLIGLAVDIAVGKERGALKEQEVREKFEKLEDLGLTDDEWGDKLNFLLHMAYEFDNMAGDMPPPPELLGFGRKFYEDNEKHFDTISENWDDWTGSDNIVSRNDLEHIAENKSNRFLPNRDFSKAEQEAAQFLLDNEDFFDFLDTLHRGGNTDDKISSADLDGWFQLMGERDVTDDNPIYAYVDEPADALYHEIFPSDVPIWEAQPELYEIFKEDQEDGTGKGMTNWRLFKENIDLIQLNVHNEEFYEDNKEEIDFIVDNWDDWADEDGTVSRDVLEERYEEIAYVGPRTVGRLAEEFKALDFLLNDDDGKSFFSLLDTFVRGGSADGEVDEDDLDGWLKIIGVRDNPDDEPIFRRDVKYQIEDSDLIDPKGI